MLGYVTLNNAIANLAQLMAQDHPDSCRLFRVPMGYRIGGGAHWVYLRCYTIGYPQGIIQIKDPMGLYATTHWQNVCNPDGTLIC